MKWLRKFQMDTWTKEGERITIANPFTLNFNIVRHTLSSAANGNLKILNLGMELRNKIFKNCYSNPEDYLPIQLRAGYEGMMPLVLKGNILEARSYRQGGAVNFTTEIEVYDGGHDLAHGDSAFSMVAGTLRVDAIRRLCADFRNCKIGAIGDFPGFYPRARVFSGPTRQLLQDETGGAFYIDNEHIYCLKDGEVIQGEVLVISSETGMLGSPTRTKGFVIAEMLFEPRMRVGQAVELISRDYPSLNQIYKVIGVQHSGTISDAVGGDCRTTVRMLYGDNQNLTLVPSNTYA